MSQISFLIALCACIAGLAWLDKRFNLNLGCALSTGLNPHSETSSVNHSKQYHALTQENKELKSRIEVLQKIVTEPSYELNKAIDALKK